MAALDWPGLDYPVIVTTSIDGTARVWDPLRPDRELTYLHSSDRVLLSSSPIRRHLPLRPRVDSLYSS